MNKQIEDMARTLCGEMENDCQKCDSCDMCEFLIETSVLYNAGYRKQSKGKWVCKWKSTFPQYEPSVYACSVCGYERTVLYNYCPNCGAKMQRKEDEGK